MNVNEQIESSNMRVIQRFKDVYKVKLKIHSSFSRGDITVTNVVYYQNLGERNFKPSEIHNLLSGLLQATNIVIRDE